jgi:hypothetical protein
MDYAETLPLVDREVVLTFDDGPIPPTPARFSTSSPPNASRRPISSSATWRGNIPRWCGAPRRRPHHRHAQHDASDRFRALSVERANCQIDDGIAATAAALGDPDKARTVLSVSRASAYPARPEHAAERGLMVWGADVPADDWRKIGPREVARRAVQRLEAKGKGILLLHDIHQRNRGGAAAHPRRIEGRGFRVVHVVPPARRRPRPSRRRRTGGRTRGPISPRRSSMALVAGLDADMLCQKERRGIVLVECGVARDRPDGAAASMAARPDDADTAKVRKQSDAGQGCAGQVAHAETAGTRAIFTPSQ